MDKKHHLLSLVKNKIKNIDPDAIIILFGSRARNDYRLIFNQDLKNKISDSLFEAELETDSVLTGMVQNIEFWKNYSGEPIFNNISKEGIQI